MATAPQACLYTAQREQGGWPEKQEAGAALRPPLWLLVICLLAPLTRQGNPLPVWWEMWA